MTASLIPFQQQVQANIAALGRDVPLRAATRAWIHAVAPFQYAYNFTWLGRPIIQAPQDIVALQEIIWQTQPDLILETGVAHGGSLIFYASMLELLGRGQVIGIDIEIRQHNRREIEQHRLAHRIRLIEQSSVDPSTVAQVFDLCQGAKSVFVALDSNHTHEHVLAELRLYSQFVRPGGYLVVFDTLIEDMPEAALGDRPWGKGNNPKTAIDQFMGECDRFEIDHSISDKLVITSAPGGYLKAK